MARRTIEAHELSLEDILESVETGSAVLPAFQRDFKWSNADAISLIATVLCGWPAGSLLLMNGAPDFFEIRAFEDGPPIDNDIQYVILDGQQRLTSLYRAFRGHERTEFVLSVTALLNSSGKAEDIEDAITVHDRDKWLLEYPPARQAEELLVPLSSLRTASDYFGWRDETIAAAAASERENVRQRLAEVYRVFLSRANSYTLPSVVIDRSLPPAAVARIFERINRTGLRLGAFDLLVARSYTNDWNLRDHWETLRTESEPIGTWLKRDGLPVLQVIALTRKKDVRQPALLDLEPEEISGNWEPAAAAVEHAVAVLRKLGVPGPDLMPYRGLLFPIAYRFMKFPDMNVEAVARELSDWFWGRSFGMGYDVGSSTRIAADARILSARSPGWDAADFAISERNLIAATRKKQSAIWSAFLTYLHANGARDLLTGAELDPNSSDVVAVSMLPKLSESDYHLRVLGLVWANRHTASKLRADPIDVIQRASRRSLESQLLPIDVDSIYRGPDTLLMARARALKQSLANNGHESLNWFA
ncbi:DUF262 domain-containing protein [Curtobacterium sp. RHCKG23]|uniref:DUF262 domain-containing protein n=1 Tax=Curtobacterium citri TaxID=3055139 RepID=A0ABT7T6H7_9MICO|nr:DUF262 domain-containing protein [Curtobacterium citri]MDM7885181.1 DUF262 domain-containing protein [Curtobacterium citri]